MTLSLLSLLLFATLLFGVATLTRRRARHRVLVPALATLGSLGALSYFGLTEMAGRYGLGALLAFMAFSLVFLFSPLVMRPIQWAAQTRQLPTLADLFSYRYRSAHIGPLVTTVLTLSCLPLVAGQLRLAGASLQLVSDGELPKAAAAALFTLLVTAFLYLFGQRITHRNRMMAALAAGSLISLAALIGIALWACWNSFGGPLAMEQWADASGQSRSIHRFDNSYGLTSLFLFAGLTLPHLYHQQAWQPSRQQMALTGWLFPLLLLLTTLTMIPLLWSGLAEGLFNPLQMYPPALAISSGSTTLQLLVTVGGLFACTGVTIMASQAVVAMANLYLLPAVNTGQSSNIYRTLLTRRRGITLIWFVLALIACHTMKTDSITTLTIVSLVGTAQLAPGLLSALYVPVLNRRGITAGLVTGLSLWAIGLFLPLFFGNWHWTPIVAIGDWTWMPGSRVSIHFGFVSWSNWLMVSLAANFTVSLLVSRYTTTDSQESFYARASMIEKIAAPQRIAPESCQLDSVQQQLAERIGETAAERELQRIAPVGTPMRPFEWRQLRSQLTANLYQLFGVMRAEKIVDEVLPLADTGALNPGDLRSLESLLAGRQQQLYGLAAELNKLRLHHQHILHQLPLGACSLDQDDEIVLWNSALETITGIRSNNATGSHLDSLPLPWRQVLGDAASGDATHQFAVEVEDGDRKMWFNLHKSVVQHSNNPLAEQVILLEDVSDAIQLTRDIAHTERLASIGRLAAGVAHEIGNPVTGIACLAQDINSEADSDDQRQSATMILTQTDRITRIVRSLIDFSRSGSESDIDISDVPLAQSLQQAVQLLALDKEQTTIDVQIEVPQDLQVRGDPYQLVQIFLNLISNARDASDDGATVSIAARPVNQQAEIQITDNGTGISTNRLDKVLEPFFTTKPAGEGTGLGLSLVYSMVRSYGGELSLHSPVANNRGTRVTIRLPLGKR